MSPSVIDTMSDRSTDPPPNTKQEFADWLAPHLSVLLATSRRLVSGADADDVLQQAVERAWKKRATFDPTRGTPRAWLLGVLVDRVRRHRRGVIRGRKRTAEVVSDFAASIGTVQEDSNPTSRLINRLDVERAVTSLPTRQREVITLHYLADLSVNEVAKLLEISEGSVKSHLHDARISLRDRLEKL
jgi:RNA polymerase sigma factor (sigma-70 family)